MKQRLHKMLSILLSVALIASACVGALSASVLPAKAADPVTGYFDDLMEQARNHCPASSLTQFDNVVQQIHDNFDSWLVVIIYRPTDNSWYVASYIQDTTKQLDFWGWRNTNYTYFYPRYLNDPSYTHSFNSRYGFKIKGNNIWFEPYNSALGNQTFRADALFRDQWDWGAPTPDDIAESSRRCYTNIDLHAYNGTSEPVFLQANLLNGSYVPPVIDFNWFKFQLGQRWYITTYDQSLVNMMVEEEDSFWAMTIDVRDDLDILTDHFTIWPDMMQRLPGAENFISQNLTNLSASGVFAYDITDLVLEDDVYYHHLDSLKFYSYSGTQYDWLTQLVAESDDVVDLVLSPDQENESQNNAWDQISDYTENYPSVTISPQELAEQVLGSRAYTGSMGTIQIPSGIYDWCVQHKPNFIVAGDTSADGYWHYKLDSSGILSTNLTMINWDLCNACLIPAPDPSWISDELGIDSYSFPVYWWNPSDQVLTDAFYIGTFTVEMILQQFDIVIFAPSDAPYLSNFDGIFSFPGSIGFTNLELDSQIGAVNGATRHQVFICSTDKVLLKSQLFAFCDSSSKMYDLLSQYIEKRDIWDESFFKWSMSVFWELETVNGHLNAIQTEVLSWHLTDKFNDLISKADQIIQNTAPVDEENVDPWYLSLWNFILQFKPSNYQISTGIDYIDQNLDDIPLLPYLTPVPALPTPGGG